MNAADGGDQSVKIKSLEAAKIMRIELLSQLLSARSWMYRSRVLQDLGNTDFYFANLDAWFLLRLSGHSNLTVQASRLSSNSLQRSFFFFARMSCSEQSAFHGQAADPVWFFSELLFQSVAAKKQKKEKKKIWKLYEAWNILHDAALIHSTHSS